MSWKFSALTQETPLIKSWTNPHLSITKHKNRGQPVPVHLPPLQETEIDCVCWMKEIIEKFAHSCPKPTTTLCTYVLPCFMEKSSLFHRLLPGIFVLTFRCSQFSFRIFLFFVVTNEMLHWQGRVKPEHKKTVKVLPFTSQWNQHKLPGSSFRIYNSDLMGILFYMRANIMLVFWTPHGMEATETSQVTSPELYSCYCQNLLVIIYRDP